MKKTGLICAFCGSLYANKGSMKHPVCEECFKKEFNNDYDKYDEFLRKTHFSYMG